MMARNTHKAPPETQFHDNGLITQVRTYEVVTPLFGGGVEKQAADPVTVVRGTEIRGLLRFWWRATRGGLPTFEGRPERMKAAEDAIWGAAAMADTLPQSPTVKLAVTLADAGRAVEKVSSGLRYVAFPLDADQQVRTGVRFELTLRFHPDFEKDVEAALWAWETFGGIGARTRRGFGALRCTEVLRNDNVHPVQLPSGDLEASLNHGLQDHVADGPWPQAVPHLQKSGLKFKIVGDPKPDATQPWSKIVGKLQGFRQARRGNKYGRSHWPEPDEIRRITKNPSAKHAKPTSGVRRFPRAQFGLPINFQFLNEPAIGKPVLRTKAHDRLASPLIIKPLACAGGYVALAAILVAPRTPPDALILQEENGKNEHRVSADLTDIDKDKIGKIGPMKQQEQVFTDPLLAFLASL